jgi:hypothetical protein
MFQLSEHYTQENLRIIEKFERTKRTGCSIVTNTGGTGRANPSGEPCVAIWIRFAKSLVFLV